MREDNASLYLQIVFLWEKKEMKTTLVIMAAGLGSRFGSGIKQLAKVGPSGEIIMDYSIYDAVQAGFDKVVFIIRRDIKDAFDEIIGNRIKKFVETDYVYQELTALPAGFTCPEDRKKPWGTGHAVLSCLGKVNEPFLVINADDFYGRHPYKSIHDFLVNSEGNKAKYCMAGFSMGNTLSDNGKVTRGVCSVDENGFLTGVEETYDLYLDGNEVVGATYEGAEVRVAPNTPVSMNMWGFTPDFLGALEGRFADFLKENINQPKAEYLLPGVVGDMLKNGEATVKVLPTDAKWFGVTYAEDKPKVIDSIAALVKAGEYPSKLF